MIHYLLAPFYLVCVALPVLAQQVAIPTQPELTVLLEPRHVKGGGAYVQGQIKLHVRLVSPHPFAALKLDLPPVANARTVILRPPHTRKLFNYGHEGFVYETRLALFPEKSGVLTIPSISVVGAVSIGSEQTESFTEVNPAMSIRVKPIDRDYDAQWWLVADTATMTEAWSPPPDALKVGDIVRREVTLTVYGVTAEHLPTIELVTSGGYSVVGSDTTTQTDLTPDGVIAVTRRFWDLRIESESVVSINPIRLEYWDPAAGAMTSVSVPAKRIEPLPRDVAALREQLMHDAITAHRKRRISLLVALAIPGLALLALMGAILRKSLPTRADRHLLQACTGSATPATCFRSITRWSHDSFNTDGRNLIGQLQQRFGGEAADRLGTLQLVLFSTTEVSHKPERLARSLVHAARRHRLREFWQHLKAIAWYEPGAYSADLPSSTR